MRKGNKERIQQGKQQAFIEKVRHRLRQGLKDNNVIIAKLAGDYGIVDKDVIKELVELAIVLQARTMAMSADLSDRLKYDQITKLYRQQVNLTHRTSQSIMLQQYSTPAPLAFLASLFVRAANPEGVFWEPSAGNGLLTIAIPPDQVVVNEIDDLRHLNLTRQGYRQVLQQDATTPITTNPAFFDGVMTNPPFGKIDTLQFNEARIKVLDHAMAIRALEKMKDDGRAAIIVGGHLTFDQQERIQAGKNMIFYAYLHRYYHVLDSINIDGSKLYSRQGTAFDVRLILIEGRKSAPAGFPPMQQDKDKQVMTSFDQLWNRVATYLYTNHNIAMNTLERDALALEIALLHNEVLEGTYYPASRASSLEVEVPDSMDYETHQAIARIAQAVGDIDEYVRQKLGFRTKQVLYKALMAEQIDAVAMAIYNMEVKKQGIIIGDQCVAAGTRIFDPVKKTHTPIELLAQRGEPITVLSLTSKGLVPAVASAPFCKGVADLYKVTMDDGRSITVTQHHRFLTPSGWLTLADNLSVGHFLASVEGPFGRNLEFCQSTHGANEQHLIQKPEDSPERCFERFRQYDEQLHELTNSDQLSFQQPAGVPEHNQPCFGRDAQDVSTRCNLACQPYGHHSRNSSFPLANHAPLQKKDQVYASDELLLEQTHRNEGQSHQLSTLHQKADEPTQPHQNQSCYDHLWHETQSLRDVSDSAPFGLTIQNVEQLMLKIHQIDSQRKFEKEGIYPYYNVLNSECILSQDKALNFADKTGWKQINSIEFVERAAFFDMWVPEHENYVAEGLINHNTGIGKGRQAAAIIRYAVNAGYMPIFLTEKPNLFTDIYRDLSDIGSGELKPFIVNARDSKTDIKDTDGKVVYRAMEAAAQKKLYDKFKQGKGSLADLKGHDYVIGLYSQFRDKDITAKQIFLRVISKNNVIIMDEAHNSSGSSNTGSFLQNIAAAADGVTFLSATFAKRPDNMPIYAMKTAISDANMSKTELVEAIVRGGVALQEVLASQLVDEGQMVRRQRSFEGIEVNYINLTEQKQQHRATCDRITEIMRDIINFQKKHVTPAIKEMDKAVREEGKKVVERAGTSQAGVNNTPYFSKIFNVINQLLFSVKAEAVAQQAIQRLKEGKKPVLAFSSTMGSFLKDMSAVSTGDETGEKVSPGSVVSADFTEVLRKGLQGVLRITTADAFGNKTYEQLNISDFDDAAQMEYLNILKKINKAASGICISPIDVLTKRLTEAGYTYGEVTGRDIELQLDDHLKTGIIQTRKKISATDAFRKFNNNELDCLLINQSGSTGASAHAVPTKKVSATQVKQRVMIVLQAELDINTEVQKRGRINRTGQIKKPIYDYLISEIPAENRLMMMLQKKLKSLDANTSSDQKNSEALLSTPDFLNKYGDNVVYEYLSDNAELNALLGDPLLLNDGNTKVLEGGAHKVSGLVAVLSTQDQEKFYNDILERYNELVAYKQQLGEYDLEVEAMDLQAETLKSQVVKVGKNANSVFGDDSFLETVRAKVLKKPFTAAEVQNMLAQTLAGKEAREIQAEIVEGFQEFAQKQLSEEQAENLSRYQHQLSHVENEKSIKKLDNPQVRQEAIEQRKKELHQAMITRGKHLVDMYEKNISHISSILNFFYPGRAIKYPKLVFGEGSSFVWGICLGLQIDEKRPNPYAPSAITVRFALASSDKFVALKLSGETGNQVMAIKGATYDISNSEANTLLERWDEIIKEASADFTTRHIITGNLLQAMASYRGKLVSYTSANNDIKKGILLPEQFNPEEDIKGKVEVPLFKALKVIRALPSGQVLVTSNNIGFLRQGEDYKIILPAARKHGGDIYLNQKILDLTEEGTFNKAGDRMVAWVRAERIADFIQVVQDEYSPSLEVTAEQFKLIETSLEKRKAKPVMDMPGQRKLPAMPAMEDEEMMLMLELEAQALELELNLNRQVA